MMTLLDEKIRELQQTAVNANQKDRVKTTVIIVVENPDGQGLVMAQQNGRSLETPLQVAMSAAEVHAKAQTYASHISASAYQQHLETVNF